MNPLSSAGDAIIAGILIIGICIAMDAILPNRKEMHVAEPTSVTTVKVRVAVAIEPNGRWSATGDWNASDEHNIENLGANGAYALHWIEMEYPVPVVTSPSGEIVL